MTTSKQKISDLEQWIKETLFDTSSLEPDTLKVVEGFVILWNIFEGSMCESTMQTLLLLKKLLIKFK